MVMGMGVNFQYPMGMSTDMGVIFENRCGCRYSLTRPIAIPRKDGVPPFSTRHDRVGKEGFTPFLYSVRPSRKDGVFPLLYSARPSRRGGVSPPTWHGRVEA